LSTGTTRIRNPLFCDDTEVTLQIAKMMGADISNGTDVEITGPSRLQAPNSEMDCRASGTTLRLFTALSALTSGRCVLTGDDSLLRRPIVDLLSALQQLGVNARSLKENDRPPVEIHGHNLIGGPVRIRGDVTSQYISGLLHACSKGEGDSTIQITAQLESQPYVEMTLEVMAHFGAKADPSQDWSRIYVPGDQDYRSEEYQVQGDYSSAAFLIAAGALSGRVETTGLRKDSKQGDAVIISLLKEMGTSLRRTQNGIVTSTSDLESLDIDVSQIPDLVPVLTLLATQAEGSTRIYNAQRLRYKESDRLSSVALELRKMGARIREERDGLTITGPTPLRGAVIEVHNDHRIAMTCIIAGLVAEGTTTVENVECVNKSYPDFIRDVLALGAQVELESDKRITGGKT
jgi:3-phosphoshikimate 1-carboxyvinyltransferase